MARKRYIFLIRAAETDTLPESWSRPGPFATPVLEASAAGLRVIPFSTAGAVAGLGILACLGFVMYWGIRVAGDALLLGDLSLVEYLLVVSLAILAFAVSMRVLVTAFAAWRSGDAGLRVHVREMTLGLLHQELRVEGGGEQTWLQTAALQRTIMAALRLTDETALILPR